MFINEDLSDFNSRVAEALLSDFGLEVVAQQSDEGNLLFRGPVSSLENSIHIGTHVVVKLDPELKRALEAATKVDHAVMLEILVSNLTSQVRARYDKNRVGQKALVFVADMKILND